MVILVCEMARVAGDLARPAAQLVQDVDACVEGLAADLDEVRAGPWNQVAVIQPSACHTVAKRSQSPASRQTTQFSTVSRIASLSAASSSTIFPSP